MQTEKKELKNEKTNPRLASVERETRETKISLTLNLDGEGLYKVQTQIPFFSHLLNTFSCHGLFDLSGEITGDILVDQHHTIEDTGIVLGTLFNKTLAITKFKGITRASSFLFPMDEALVLASVDFGGRAYLAYDLPITPSGTFQFDCLEDFWRAFCDNAHCALHIKALAGRSAHHVAEASFKAVSRALSAAVRLDPRRLNLPSTKGFLQ